MANQKIIFHVGTTKTGTTSIQHALMSSRVRLLEEFSLYYPFSPRLVQKVERKENDDESFIGGGNFEKKIIKAFKSGELDSAEQLLSGELQKVSQQGALTTLYSAEVLFGLGKSLQACELLSRVASRFFSEVEIVCCIRPPLDHTASRYCEYVKRRSETRSFNDCFNDLWLDFGSRLDCFVQAFGASRLTVLPYEHPSKVSIVKRFFAHVDSRLLKDAFFSSIISNMNRNRSLSPLECEAVRHVNRLQIGYGLNSVSFVKAYGSYLKKFPKDNLRRYFHVSDAALRRFEDLNQNPLERVGSLCGACIPIASTRVREGMLSAAEEFSIAEQSKIQEVAWQVLREVNASF